MIVIMVAHLVRQNTYRSPFGPCVAVKALQKPIIINDVTLVTNDGGISVIDSILLSYLEILLPIDTVQHIIYVTAGLIYRGEIRAQRSGRNNETTFIDLLCHCGNTATS